MFHVDIERMCPTLEEMAAFALRGMNESQRDTLAEYLDHLLSDDYTPDGAAPYGSGGSTAAGR